MCAPSPPPPPDYGGLAKQQSAADKETALVQARMNNPNVVGPGYTQRWTEGPTPESRPTLTQELSPEEQAIHAKQQQMRGKMGDIGQRAIENVGGVLSTPFDPKDIQDFGSTDFTSGLPALRGREAFGPGTDIRQGASPIPGSADQVRNQVIGAMMSRVDEDVGKQRENLNSNLIAAGLRPGTQAYDDQMNMINRQYNDARQQALIAGGNAAQQQFEMDAARRGQLVGENVTQSGIDLDRAARGEGAALTQRQQLGAERGQQSSAQDNLRRQQIAEYMAKRQVPINEISALMSGSQVQNPFAAPGMAQNTAIPQAPIYQAGMQAGQYGTDVYNQQVAGRNATNTGLFGLGSAAIGSKTFLPWMFSDRRLKSNIRRIGTHPLGIGIYAYDIFGRRDIGVMADEVFHVKPDAVRANDDGYLMVDYGRL